MERYDLVVIGSGPAGEKGASQAAYFGKRVAVVDEGARWGGVCVHTGTIPSKTLRETCLYLSGKRSRGLYGVNYLVRRDHSVGDLMYRKEAVVSKEVDRIQGSFDRHRIDTFCGRAKFEGRNSVMVQGQNECTRLEADFFLIATGSSPWHPDYLPFEHQNVYDSDTILKMKEVPRSMCIIGAGVIGCEYATMFAALGIRVVLINRKSALLPFLDGDLSCALKEQMMELGIQILLDEEVDRVSPEGDKLNVVLSSGDDFEVASVLFAAGRMGNTKNLGLETVGIEPNSRGLLEVNEHYQTPVPHIYAGGDVIGFPALASTSTEQGRVAMCHAFELKYKTAVSELLPFGIYTIPEISMVGKTEQECQDLGILYEIGQANFSENARGNIMGDETGFIKLVFCPDSLKVLGVHIIGSRASELVHIGQACMHFGGTIDYFIQTVFNYPTLSEAYKYAAYKGLGRLSKSLQTSGAKAAP